MTIENGPSNTLDTPLESGPKKPESIPESAEMILGEPDIPAEFQENEVQLAMLRESVVATETGLDKTRDELEIPHSNQIPPSIAQAEEKISLLDARQNEIRDFVPEIEFAEGEEYLETLRAHFADLKGSEGNQFMIEEGVLDTVAAFNALGYETSMSCEGHAEGRGAAYAWISFKNDFSRTSEGQEYEQLTKEAYRLYKSNKEKGLKFNDIPEYENIKELQRKVVESDTEFIHKLEAQLAEFQEQQGGGGDFKYAIEKTVSSPRIVPEISKRIDDNVLDKAQRQEWVEKSRAELARLTSYLKEKYIAESAKPSA
ncbi:MAG: hypothetical protein JWO73_516 [Candidatus Taylorbacteria bacterium]|nr:hypothetical protein [Candidatus Taylorbacteria bacterium]